MPMVTPLRLMVLIKHTFPRTTIRETLMFHIQVGDKRKTSSLFESAHFNSYVTYSGLLDFDPTEFFHGSVAERLRG